MAKATTKAKPKTAQRKPKEIPPAPISLYKVDLLMTGAARDPAVPNILEATIEAEDDGRGGLRNIKFTGGKFRRI